MKERLTGAVILVAVIVLLVPELLSGPLHEPAPRPTSGSAEEAPLRSYTIDLAEDSHSRAAMPSGMGTEVSPPNGPAQPRPVGSVGEGASGNGTDTPAAAATNPPHTDSADAAAGAMTQEPPSVPDGPPVNATSSVAPVAPRTETRSAPSGATPPAASAEDSAGNARTGSARSASAGSGGLWMVQLGSFASRPNADHLAQELKGKGFRVAVSESSSSKGHPLYRVRVGPAPDRAAAEQLASKVRTAGHPGSVVPVGPVVRK